MLNEGQNVYLKDRERVRVPPVVWSPNLKYGFVGCMRDLVINGRATDIVDYAKNQDSGMTYQKKQSSQSTLFL